MSIELKTRAKRLKKALSKIPGVTITHSQILELIAAEEGYPNWDAACKCYIKPRDQPTKEATGNKLLVLTPDITRGIIIPNNEQMSIINEAFASSDADFLVTLMTAFLPKMANNGNDIFVANAKKLIEGVLPALVELRDRGDVLLSPLELCSCLKLSFVFSLAERRDLAKSTTAAIKSFLRSVGWQEGVSEKEQPKSLSEQFGYARSYWGSPLNLMINTPSI